MDYWNCSGTFVSNEGPSGPRLEMLRYKGGWTIDLVRTWLSLIVKISKRSDLHFNE